jgi:hypothetical protein
MSWTSTPTPPHLVELGVVPMLEGWMVRHELQEGLERGERVLERFATTVTW